MAFQFLVAVDQVINTLCYAKYEGFGYADESISARCFRLQHSRNWNIAKNIIDSIFFILFRQMNHCEIAYIAECERLQLPLYDCDTLDF